MSESRARTVARAAIVTLLVSSLSLAGCGAPAVQSISSLAPTIRGDALGYNQAFGDLSEQIILTNVLRARDREPIDISELSSVSGALSLQGSLGFTFPFGAVNGSNTRDSLGPTVTGSTSPTFSLAPLDTEGFTLGVLQPVSASYVANRWHAGLSREMLMMLFVKDIEFPELVADKAGTKVLRYKKFVNDPNDDAAFVQFHRLVDALLQSSPDLRTFDILDPVGPPFPFLKPASGAIAAPNSDAFNLVMQNGNVQYRVGNAAPGDGSRGQLYREYPGQVALCIDTDALEGQNYDFPRISYGAAPAANPPHPARDDDARRDHHGRMAAGAPLPPPPGDGAPPAPAPAAKFAVPQNLFALDLAKAVLSTQFLGGAGKSPGAGGPKSAAGSAGSSGGGGSAQSASAALEAGRYGTIVDERGCGASEIVLAESSETHFERTSAAFVQIQWRSVSELFEYLGALLRHDERVKQVTRLAGTPDSAVQGDAAGGARPEPLFVLDEGRSNRPTVRYGGGFYTVRAGTDGDETMVAIGMVTTLVNLAKVSGDVPVSQPLRLLPLP